MKSFIDQWRNEILSFKYKVAKHDGFFKSDFIQFVHSNLYKFFADHSEYIDNDSRKNWLRNDIVLNDFTRIGYTSEIAVLINHYYDLKESGEVKDDYTKIPSFELRNRLFEIYINLLLGKNKFDVIFDDHYTIKSSHHKEESIIKPIDSSLIYNDLKYVVECQKLYNSNVTSLIKIAKDLFHNFLFLRNQLRELPPDVVPTGYIIFHNQKNVPKIERTIRGAMLSKYRKYLSGMGSHLNILRPVFHEETEDYTIHIESSILADYKDYDRKTDASALSVVFKYHLKDFNTGQGKFSISVINSYTTEYISNIIHDKVRAKVKQHRNTELQKIIFFELEENTHSDDNLSLHVPKERLDYKIIESALSDNVSLGLIFKRFYNYGVYHDYHFIPSVTLDSGLSYKLKHLNLNIYNFL